jgi:hypothetical protein
VEVKTVGKISRSPRRATPIGNLANTAEAWWYESAGSIEVIACAKDGTTTMCRIRRGALKDWLARSEKRGAG